MQCQNVCRVKCEIYLFHANPQPRKKEREKEINSNSATSAEIGQGEGNSPREFPGRTYRTACRPGKRNADYRASNVNHPNTSVRHVIFPRRLTITVYREAD